jgi:ATP-binding cassette subfamily B protein
MTKLIKHLKPYWVSLLGVIILVSIQVAANLKLPDYMAKIVNQGIVGLDNSIVWHTGVEMLLVTLIGAIATIGLGYLASKISTGVSRDIREAVFAKVESFSLAEFNKFSTASLITRSTNDIQQVQTVLGIFLRMVLAAPIMGVGAIIKAYAKAPNMSWIIILGIVIMFIVIATLFIIAMPKFKLLQKLVDKLNLVTRENLTGLRVIRAFNNEEFEKNKFHKTNTDLTNANLFVNRLMVVMQPVMMLLFNLTSVAIVWVGAKFIDSGSLQIGDMMAFMQYAMQVIMSFLMVSIIFIMLPRASVSAERVAEVITTELVIKEPKQSKKSEAKAKGTVEFRNVSFSYLGADTPVLENISFTAKSGETTAFIGSTGSGKTTLISLIPRFYDVDKGEVLVDGVNVKDYMLNDLYKKIGFVPQKGVLFSGTIESNIRYGKPEADEKAVESAAKTAQAMEFIESSEHKFKNNIAQGGQNVSGGQKQRLAIARALLLDPEIYIFDDSFSALDFKTDLKLRAALAKETNKKTVLIVGQRISTIMNAEKIIVLDEGKIVGEGKHSELIKDCSVYREIASSQLSEEELKNIASTDSKKETK